MKRSDLELIQRYLANLRPNMRTAPVIEHTEWRRVVEGLGAAFQGSPWAHLYDHGEWLHGTGAEVREPAPREGEPYEQDGAWYNLTESEARARGLVPDPAAPRWLTPRNLGPDGQPIVDVAARMVIDALTGEWRDMTDAEQAQYPAPTPVDPADYRDARESSARRNYCRALDPTSTYWCTRPIGHGGLHAAVNGVGAFYRSPWTETPVPAPVPAQPARECGDEYEDDDGDIHTCTEPRGHYDDAGTDHTDGDISW